MKAPTTQAIERIRQLYVTSGLSVEAIAAVAGSTRHTVRVLISRYHWTRSVAQKRKLRLEWQQRACVGWGQDIERLRRIDHYARRAELGLPLFEGPDWREADADEIA